MSHSQSPTDPLLLVLGQSDRYKAEWSTHFDLNFPSDLDPLQSTELAAWGNPSPPPSRQSTLQLPQHHPHPVELAWYSASESAPAYQNLHWKDLSEVEELAHGLHCAAQRQLYENQVPADPAMDGMYHSIGVTQPGQEISSGPSTPFTSYESSATLSSASHSPFGAHVVSTSSGTTSTGVTKAYSLKMDGLDFTGESSSFNTAARSRKLGKESRQSVTINKTCQSCDALLGSLILRGSQDQLRVPFMTSYECSDCTSESSGAAPVIERTSTLASCKSVNPSTQLSCDVCKRIIAHEVKTPANISSVSDVALEVVCAGCSDRYRRCTDCGGGGVPSHIGIGKWRSKQLFEDNRRTCRFSHQRTSSLADMSCDIWPAQNLPIAHVKELVKVTRQLYLDTVLRRFAVPEVLEMPDAKFASYDELLTAADNYWTTCEPFFEGVKDKSDRANYVAIRWGKPKARKGTNTKDGQEGSTPLRDPPPDGIIRADKVADALALSEMDFAAGRLFLTFILPNKTGEVFRANTRLLQCITDRVQDDIKKFNGSRKLRGLALYPGLKEVWTIVRHSFELPLAERRGFLPLDLHLKQHPGASRRDYVQPPAFGVPQKLLQHWQVYVKEWTDAKTWSGFARLKLS